ncbi:peptidase [Mycobacterium sp. PS03-16]|uniref:peptidase n=1 Tax=Mycobacterium sp. PS03-16 TaxID=2559611 RepID=UPI003526FCEE
MLIAEFVFAVLLLDRPTAPAAPPVAADVPAAPASSPAVTTATRLPDGRTAQLIPLGGARSTPVLERIAAELPGAADAITRFWGPDWRRDLVIVATGSDAQFTALAGGGADIAAATTSDRVVFAPGAAGMTDAALRIVVRHELFHHATRQVTAADAPRWLTEGVADYVARPRAAAPAPELLTALPTDADLDTAGATRSAAYDRAWWFATYVADRYGPQQLRALYVRACGPGHPDPATAIREVLGLGVDEVLGEWQRWPAR